MIKNFKKKFGLKVEINSVEERYNASVEFKDTPAECYCPYCKTGIISLVEFQNSCLTYTFAFLIFIFLGWVSFIVLPFIWSILQDCVHLCPNCKNTITYNRRCSCPAVNKDIITIQIGSCAIVLSRKYVYVLSAMLLLIFLVTITRWYNIMSTDMIFTKGEEIDKTWEDFLGSCGLKGQFRNYLKAETKFYENYFEKTVSWQGVLMKIYEDIWGRTILLMKMDPSQFDSNNLADLRLLADPELHQQIAKLDLGDKLTFKATLQQLGTRFEPHIGYLWEF